MAKQVIVLGKSTDGVFDNFQIAFWYPIASSPKTQANGSIWTGASAAENTAIQAGTVLEESESVSVPVGLATGNAAAVEAWLLQIWTNRNAQLNGVGPAQFAGVYYDPSAGGWA